ncbi:cysteine desulfuration protein SufE [Kineococcus rhizosphaerae]|uniref:Cysteine desulfuration protein SufE n=2 Tax=Kineococcus rhizosphaerae TaxID=559628 RepID=A0A2T0R9K2_9ACTN|nr:SufE family protein [Kineococcus rhizosphaerae]PRY17845.1 cysteine desulfuration protein SufE [Kineococcus rhizosphaerae]
MTSELDDDPVAGLPPAMAEIVEDFQALGERERLQLLLEFSQGLKPLPAEFEGHLEKMERVDECQSPVFVHAEVDADRAVHLHVSAPAEAPTTRGFAGVLQEGLEGLPADVVLDLPPDVCHRLGLEQAVSPLRMRGMTGMLARVKRQVRVATAA